MASKSRQGRAIALRVQEVDLPILQLQSWSLGNIVLIAVVPGGRSLLCNPGIVSSPSLVVMSLIH